MTGLRTRESLDAEETQELTDALSRLWRERNHLYTNRLAKAAKMLLGMIDVEAREVASTGDATTRETDEVASTGDATTCETDEVASTGDATSPLAGGERREREKSPLHPPKEKDQETNNNNNARARGMVFTKPTVEEVAALTAGV